MTYTANPELDAARHEDALAATADFHDEAMRNSPLIVYSDLKRINTAAQWNSTLFPGGHSAQEILDWALGDKDQETTDSFDAFLLTGDLAERDKMLKAMAEFFAKVYFLEIYTAHLEDLQ